MKARKAAEQVERDTSAAKQKKAGRLQAKALREADKTTEET